MSLLTDAGRRDVCVAQVNVNQGFIRGSPF